ncbi:universal stress protein [Pontibacter sp. G13]|uniref:universal stress protein n=1 Tax=Pontibacter sp. G13 TaxID=3074898 RepID=UPI00288AE65B|nr:universal stress protein [Pontibacter sp. G13]WNJ18554.1 universal stress protein [Pontibacter sp. G13]
MKQILVPINLRAQFQHVVKYAESVALKSGARPVFYYAGGPWFMKGSEHQVYHSESPIEPFLDHIRNKRARQTFQQVCEGLKQLGVDFSFKLSRNRSLSGLTQEVTEGAYDLLVMGSGTSHGIRGYLRSSVARRVIATVKTPVFVIPQASRYNEIEHITYAVDLADYDPAVIQQVKSIAGLFDAKLTIVHVNSEGEGLQKENYMTSLERTISDTLDYPKIYYKFFDHADVFRGIKKFVTLNGSNLIAMTNRKSFTWRNFFSKKSMTGRMTREMKVPILAFRKDN